MSLADITKRVQFAEARLDALEGKKKKKAVKPCTVGWIAIPDCAGKMAQPLAGVVGGMTFKELQLLSHAAGLSRGGSRDGLIVALLKKRAELFAADDADAGTDSGDEDDDGPIPKGFMFGNK